MGSSVSTSSKQVGVWHNGQPVYEVHDKYVEAMLDKHLDKTLIVDDSGRIPQGYEFWLHYRGVKYAKAADPTRDILRRNSARSAAKISKSQNISIADAQTIVDIMLPVLCDADTAAAQKTLETMHPNLAKYGPAAAKELMAGCDKNLYKPLTASPPVSSHAYYAGMEAMSGVSRNGSQFVTGGCECGGKILGAADIDTSSMLSYVNTVNSASKEKIIADLLAAAEKLGLDAKGATNKDKFKSLVERIPAKVGKDDTAQIRICKSMAAAINTTYGQQIIDPNVEPSVLCQQIAEFLTSLTSGTHAEFLAVYNDVRRVLKNLHALKLALREDYEKQRSIIGTDSGMRDRLASLADIHEKLLAEIDRQLALMSNLLGATMAPTEKTLAELLKSEKGMHGIIEKIDVEAGDVGFGQVISHVLRGMGVTGSFVTIIQDALKKINMSLKDYVAMNDVGELRKRVTDKMLGAKMNEDDLHAYLKAADLLYKNLYRRDEIEKVAVRGAGESYLGSCGEDGAVTGGASAMARRGGAIESYGKSTLDRRVEDRVKMRRVIFRAFYDQLNGLFDSFVNCLDKITQKAGDEIPMSDTLDGFREVLDRVNEGLIRNKNIYYALIGYYNDAMSKSLKDELVSQLKHVIDYIAEIEAMPLYKSHVAAFAELKSYLSGIILLIDKFSDELAAKFGRGETPAPAEIDYKTAKMGAADLEGITGIAEVAPEIRWKSRSTIHDSIRKFSYKYRVAQIRANMKAMSGELSHYSEKYKELVANSIAAKVTEERKKFDILDNLLRKEENNATAIQEMGKLVGATNSPYKDMAAQYSAARHFLDFQWDAKKKFWATVEAMDEYMRIFTDSIAKNPGDVKDIKSMLDQIEVIADWYSENTGDIMTSVFEQFPFHAEGDGSEKDDLNKAFSSASSNNTALADGEYTKNHSHYYATVKRSADANIFPGNHLLLTSPTQGVAAKQRIRQTFSSLSALKNLLSVFIHIGDKFANQSIHRKGFMTPAQMYTNLIDYLQASAFSQGMFRMPAGTTPIINKNNTKIAHSDMDFTINIPMFDNYTPDQKYGIQTGLMGNLGSSVSPIQFFKRNWGIFMPQIVHQIHGASIMNFSQENNYFVLMLKSAAAKIFTVTGLYDLLDRPAEYNGIDNPIRMILGGNSFSTEVPKIQAEAVPLYLRLPLLAQFYRDLFQWQEVGGEKLNMDYRDYNLKRKNSLAGHRISMVPDLDGPFAGIVHLIFRQLDGVNTEDYTDSNVADIIREINLLYQRMYEKFPENTVKSTIDSFVVEINRRYGIVSKDDIEKYEEEFGPKYRDDYLFATDEEPSSEYPILPGETDEIIPTLTPSQRLLSGEVSQSKSRINKYGIDYAHKKLINNFRCMVDDYFVGKEHDGKFTFRGAIKATQLKLKKETNDEKRFNIAKKLILGTELRANVDHAKYLMFHETVIAGLNALSSIHTMLARFRTRVVCNDIDEIEKTIWECLKNSPGTTTFTTNDLIRKHIKRMEALPYNPNGLAEYNNKFAYEIFSSISTRDYNGFPSGVLAQSKDFPGSSPDITLVITQDPVSNKHFVTPSNISNQLGNLLESSTPVALEDYIEAYKNKPWNKKDTNKNHSPPIETFMRHLINREYLMTDLIESLFGIGADLQGLVSYRIEDGKIHIQFSQLKSVIESLFSSVGYFLEMLRPHIDSDILKKYIDKNNPGSYYWLVEHLRDKLIEGRKAGRESTKNGMPTNKKYEYPNLEDLAVRVGNTFRDLTRKWDYCAVFDQAIFSIKPSQKKSDEYVKYDRAFARLIFYDSFRPNSGILDSSITSPNDEVVLSDFMGSSVESLHFAQSSSNQKDKTLDTRYIARFGQIYTFGNEFTLNRSAMFAFNQLIAKYLQTFYDPIGEKIYGGLILPLTSGIFSQSIVDLTKTYPDVVPCSFLRFSTSGTVTTDPSVSLAGYFGSTGIDNDALELTTRILDFLATRGTGTYDATNVDIRINSDLGKKIVLPDQNKLFSNGISDTEISIGNNPVPARSPGVVQANTSKFGFFKPPEISEFSTKNISLELAKVFIAHLFSAVAASYASRSGVITQLINTDAGVLASWTNITALLMNNGSSISQIYSETNKLQQTDLINLLISNGILQSSPVRMWVELLNYLGDSKWLKTYDCITAEESISSKHEYGTAIIAAIASWPEKDIILMNDKLQTAKNIRRLAEIFLYLGKSYKNLQSAFNEDVLREETKQFTDSHFKTLSLLEKRQRNIIVGNLYIAAVKNEYNKSLGAGAQPVMDVANLNAAQTNAVIAAMAQPLYNSFSDFSENIGPDHPPTAIINSHVAVEGRFIPLVRNIPMPSIIDRANSEYTRRKQELSKILQGGKVYSEPKSEFAGFAVPYKELINASIDKKNIFRSSYEPSLHGDELLLAYRDSPGNGLDDKIGMQKLSASGQPYPINAQMAKESSSLRAIQTFGNRMEPDKEHVLCSSIAALIRTIASEKDSRAQILAKILDNRADVAEFVAEKMRAELPVFRTLFSELSAKCSFLKQIINISSVDVSLGKVFTMGGGASTPLMNPWPFVLHPPSDDNDVAKRRYAGILDTLISGCDTMVKSCDNVLKEIGDDPKYLEVGKDSIKDYREKNNQDPLMPITSMFAYLKNDRDDTYLNAFPIHANSTPAFKLQYASRGIIHNMKSNPLMEHNKGFSNIIEQHNIMLEAPSQIDKKRANDFHEAIVRALRYLIEIKHFKGILTPYVHLQSNDPRNMNDDTKHISGMFTRDDLVFDKQSWRKINRPDEQYIVGPNVYIPEGTIDTGKSSHTSLINWPENNRNVVYSINKSFDDTIALTESASRDERIKDIANYIFDDEMRTHNLAIQNILDLNIVPINPFAIMREIPLTALYNYAYTFDRMIVELYYGLKDENARKMIESLCNDDKVKLTDGQSALVGLLIDPYKTLKISEYSPVREMFIGLPVSNELGRPKFLSDQIYGKAVFGELYSINQSSKSLPKNGPLETNIAAKVLLRQEAHDLIIDLSYHFALQMNEILGGALLSGDSISSPFTRNIASCQLIHTATNDPANANQVTVASANAATRNYLKQYIAKLLKNMRVGAPAELIAPKYNVVSGASGTTFTVTNTPNKLATESTVRVALIIAITIVKYLSMLINRRTPDIASEQEVHNYYRSLLLLAHLIMYNLMTYFTPPSPLPTNKKMRITLYQAGEDELSVLLTRQSAAEVKSELAAAVASQRYGSGFSAIEPEDFRVFIQDIIKQLTNSNITLELTSELTTVAWSQNYKFRNMDTYPSIGPRILNNAAGVNGLNQGIPDTLHWISAYNADPSDKKGRFHGQAEEEDFRARNATKIHKEDVRTIGHVLRTIGQSRFDTIFIRNLVFIINLYRTVRLRLQRDLVYDRDIIQKSIPITRIQLTEYQQNQSRYARTHFAY